MWPSLRPSTGSHEVRQGNELPVTGTDPGDGGEGLLSARLADFWAKHVDMTEKRPKLPNIRWAVQPVWWTDQSVSDPSTFINLENDRATLNYVDQYYRDMVRASS